MALAFLIAASLSAQPAQLVLGKDATADLEVRSSSGAKVTFSTTVGTVTGAQQQNGVLSGTVINDADEGTVLIGGQELGSGRVQRARRLGLMTAYQDTSLVADLSVADNIAMSFDAIGARKPGA